MVLDDIFNIAGTAAVDSVLQDLTTADSLLRSMPITGWTLLACMLTLGIGQTFEYTIHNIRHAVSSSLLPVVEAILGELTVIGFSGLLLGTIQAGSEDSLFGRFSEHYLGDAHELFELLEGVEHALFPTTVAFVAACAAIVLVVNGQFESFKQSTQAEILRAKLDDDERRAACADPASEACRVARNRRDRINGLMLESLHVPRVDGNRLNLLADALFELVKPRAARRAEFLRFRARFIEQGAEKGRPLPEDFHFGRYLQLSAAENLRGLVSVEPLQLIKVWLPLITIETALLSLNGGADGDFLPSLFGLAQIPIGTWAAWNYVRLHRIKTLLTPQLGILQSSAAALAAPAALDSSADFASAVEAPRAADELRAVPERVLKLMPPRYTLLGGSFRQRRTILDALAVFEAPFRHPAESNHDELFGILGAAGPAYYLSSMKLVLFSAIVSIAFFVAGGGEDLVISSAEQVVACLTSPATTTAEDACQLAASLQLVVGPLAMLPSLVAVALTPYTFINFMWATSVEGKRKQDVADAVLREQREGRFRVTLASLARLCAWIESAGGVAESVERSAPLSSPSALTAKRRSAEDVDVEWGRLLASQPPEVLLSVRALFESRDADLSGTIGLDEVGSIVRELGYTHVSSAGLRTLFDRMDVSGDGEISFVEFATAVLTPVVGDADGGASSLSSSNAASLIPPELYATLYAFFDTDGSDTIDENEMLHKLGALGFDLRGVSKLFDDIAGPETGVVSRGDFMRYLERMAPA